MSKYSGSLIASFIVAWLFVCAVGIVIDANAIAQTHNDPHPSDSSRDHEKPAGGSQPVTMIDPAAEPPAADTHSVARLSHDNPTLLVGKVLDFEDRAIAKTTVTLTEADGTNHTTTSDSFGNFRFDEILTGQQVVLSAEASKYSFSDLPIGITGETVVSWRASTK